MRFFCLFLLFPSVLFSQSQFELAEQLIAKKQFDKAEKIIFQYVVSNPNDVKGIEWLGDIYSNQKKWDDAQSYYKKLTELVPNNANFLYKYGGALGMKALSVSKWNALGIIGDIKSSFLKAAELDPTHIDVRWALVELYMKLPSIIGGSTNMALKYANELEKLSTVDGYLAKGYIYEADKQPLLAEEYYKKAVAIGGSLTCYNKLTNFYEKHKQPEKAIANIEAAKLKHDHNLFNYQIGKLAAEFKVELDKGEQYLYVYLKDYIALDNSSKAWAYYRLAQIYRHKKDKHQAIKYIDLAISEQPNIASFKKEKEAIYSL